MTAKERAARVRHWACLNLDLRQLDSPVIPVALESCIAAAIEDAVAEEREACAQLVEDCRESNWLNVANALRNRGKP